MKLREFRTKYLTKLLNLTKSLKEKYPDKAERIEYLTSILSTKLYNLRTFTLADYVYTLYLASTEFSEFANLIPSEQEVNELYKDQDDEQ
jgi:hypothetical protein